MLVFDSCTFHNPDFCSMMDEEHVLLSQEKAASGDTRDVKGVKGDK